LGYVTELVVLICRIQHPVFRVLIHQLCWFLLNRAAFAITISYNDRPCLPINSVEKFKFLVAITRILNNNRCRLYSLVCTSSVWNNVECPGGRIDYLFDSYRIDGTTTCVADACCASKPEECCFSAKNNSTTSSTNNDCQECSSGAAIWDIPCCMHGMIKNVSLFGKLTANVTFQTCIANTSYSSNKDDCCIPDPSKEIEPIMAKGNPLMLVQQ
jgi:hypothetical protein